MSMEKLRCPVCSHYALCSIGGEITDNQARTCKAYSYIPTPSAPRPIYSPVDHYDVDVSTGTVTYHVVQTNGDQIRSMTDGELAVFLSEITSNAIVVLEIGSNGKSKNAFDWYEWLKEEVKDG